MSRIETRDAQGKPNGYLLPIWHVDEGPTIEQVYMTSVMPGAMKGPHLHMNRRGLFVCLNGSVRVVWRVDGVYHHRDLLQGQRLEIPAGVPAALYNIGTHEADLLNMPSPPWRESEPDEWPVEEWQWPVA